MRNAVYLNDLGIINALGRGKEKVRDNMLAGLAPGMGQFTTDISNQTFYAGRVIDTLPVVPAKFSAIASRNIQLLMAALQEIDPVIHVAIERYSPKRIGVVIGTSTSGVAETELALAAHKTHGVFPAGYGYRQQEIGVSAEFIAEYFQIKGPVFGISTACTSSSKVFASARGLIEQGHCDAVITGGVDSLCELTLNGFKSLAAISDTCCNPFSINRKGINIGEAAAIFLMSKEKNGVLLAGEGASSDAYHISAPDPSGEGARQAMLSALDDAALMASDIDYLNLHGTGTLLNDAMESHAVYSVFGDNILSSSSKPLTGHTLGAAGATEAGLCWLLLSTADKNRVLPHQYDGQYDLDISRINLCEDAFSPTPVNYIMSNSFAFGGNNVSLILGRV